jgi:hypothetical protein
VKRTSASSVVAKQSSSSKSSVLRKLKRSTKQGVKSMLLSPLFHRTFKGVVTTCFVIGLLYSSYLYINKTFANEVIVSQSEIVARVGRLMPLPKEEPYDIVRVQDEETLRKQNTFYKDVREGEYILIYKNLAIIYDLRNNIVVGVKRD